MNIQVRDLLWLVALTAACGGSPSAPSGSRFQVTFTSQAPDRCASPCVRLAWVDQGSVAQGLLKLAVQVQNIPASGISSVENFLTGKASGTFSQASSSFAFSMWNAGDFFERLGKPVRYEVSDFPSTVTCCLTSYSVGFPTPTATDRVSGDGTLVVLTYKLREAGTVDLDPGGGILSVDPVGFIFATSYTAQVQVTGK